MKAERDSALAVAGAPDHTAGLQPMRIAAFSATYLTAQHRFLLLRLDRARADNTTATARPSWPHRAPTAHAAHGAEHDRLGAS